MRPFLLPLDVIPLHHGGKLLLFGLYPLRPFGSASCAALEALRRQRLLQRHTGIQPSLAPGGKRHKVNVDVWRGLVHMEVCREYPEVWIALLKALIIFVQYLPRQFCVFAGSAHILLVSDLQDDLVERLLLISRANLLIVVRNAPVCTGLLLVVPFQSLIKKLVVYRLNAFIAIINVQVRAAPVYIFRFEFAAVVIDRAFTNLGTDCPFHKTSLPFTLRPQPGFCYSCQE